jgi:hypothetical protein
MLLAFSVFSTFAKNSRFIKARFQARLQRDVRRDPIANILSLIVTSLLPSRIKGTSAIAKPYSNNISPPALL